MDFVYPNLANYDPNFIQRQDSFGLQALSTVFVLDPKWFSRMDSIATFNCTGLKFSGTLILNLNYGPWDWMDPSMIQLDRSQK